MYIKKLFPPQLFIDKGAYIVDPVITISSKVDYPNKNNQYLYLEPSKKDKNTNEIKTP